MPRKSKALFAPPQGLVAAFGETRYPGGIGEAKEFSLQGTKREIRGRLREQCPVGPGVYGFVDRIGVITYVGMSSSLRKRLSTYFSSKVGHRKEFRIGRKCVTLFWQPVAHTFLARLRELELIHRFRPQDNVEGQPTRTGLGYIVQTTTDVPSFEVKAQVTRKTRYVWGPLPMGRRTQAAVEELNRAFLLRDCPPSTRMQFKDELPLLEGNTGIPCLRADLQTCLAPCIGGCTSKQYSQATSAARKFLNGTNTTVLEKLRAEMQAAVATHRFERAARLRDLIESLERLNLLLRWFHDWIERATFVYLLPEMQKGFDSQAVVVVRGNIQDIVAGASQKQVAGLLKKAATPSSSGKTSVGEHLAKLPPEHYEIARFLFRWFRRYPNEQKKLHRAGKRRKAA